jgi:antitoxin component of MazEF toxin-antitoxin module
MKALTRIRAVGGSLVATIPKEIVEEEGLIENELVEIKVEKLRKSGFGLIRGIGKFTKKDELNTEL